MIQRNYDYRAPSSVTISTKDGDIDVTVGGGASDEVSFFNKDVCLLDIDFADWKELVGVVSEMIEAWES